MIWGLVITAAILLVLQSRYEKVSEQKHHTRRRKPRHDPRIDHYRALLDSHYKCREPYTIEICNCKPKKYMGLYYPGDAIIRIYAGWQKYHSLDEIALHEYAHHIQFTEYPDTIDPNEMHNATFWDILQHIKTKTLPTTYKTK